MYLLKRQNKNYNNATKWSPTTKANWEFLYNKSCDTNKKATIIHISPIHTII